MVVSFVRVFYATDLLVYLLCMSLLVQPLNQYLQPLKSQG